MTRPNGSWGPRENPKRIKAGHYTYRGYTICNLAKYRWCVTDPSGEVLSAKQGSVNYAAVFIDGLEAKNAKLTPTTQGGTA